MPTRKYRRTVDSRVASIARQLSQEAAGNENLQEALLAVAISACSVSSQTQSLLAVCKVASNAFATAKGAGDLANKGNELFGRLGESIVKSSDGIFTEALESLVAVATEALPADQRLRTLTNLAIASGLDPSQIALDYEEHTVDAPEPERTAPEEPNIEYNIFNIDAFTEIAAVRRMSEIQPRVEPDGRFLVGLGADGRSWFRISRLQCDDEEARRVAEAVKNRLYRRM
jgi:hypothetical protein